MKDKGAYNTRNVPRMQSLLNRHEEGSYDAIAMDPPEVPFGDARHRLDRGIRGAEASAGADVKVLATPDGGIQPQATIDDRGAIHLVYFKGDPAGGDLFYCRLEPGAEPFSTPVRVNSQPGAAIAIGTIRGGQIAIGRGGRIHVAWNGSNGARPRNPAGSNPMLYTRSILDPGGKGTTFEPQRNLMQQTSALDGGGTIAADRAGNVYVAWHGRTEDAGPGEAGRRMWVVRSKDDGATFSAEEPALDAPDRSLRLLRHAGPG